MNQEQIDTWTAYALERGSDLGLRVLGALALWFVGRALIRMVHRFVGASLDHSVWFHRPSRADEWHWFDTRSHGLAGGRGLATGDVLRADGTHVATIAQQILLRRNRKA